MPPHNVMSNIEAHAQASERCIACVMSTVEAFENVLLVGWSNTNTIIADANECLFFRGGEEYIHTVGLWRILDGVGDQVGKNLT